MSFAFRLPSAPDPFLALATSGANCDSIPSPPASVKEYNPKPLNTLPAKLLDALTTLLAGRYLTTSPNIVPISCSLAPGLLT